MRKHDRDGTRKCRNWQTSKTKDLVGVFSCGFKSHLPHEELRSKDLGFFCFDSQYCFICQLSDDISGQ